MKSIQNMDELLEHLNIIADPNVLYMMFSHNQGLKETKKFFQKYINSLLAGNIIHTLTCNKGNLQHELHFK